MVLTKVLLITVLQVLKQNKKSYQERQSQDILKCKPVKL